MLLFDIYSCVTPEPCDNILFYKTVGMESSIYKMSDSVSCSEDKNIELLSSQNSSQYNKTYINLMFKDDDISGDHCKIAKLVNNIKNIVITSNNDYNQYYKKDSILNNIFIIKYFDGEMSNIRNIQCPVALISYFNKTPECAYKIYLYFNQAPDSIRPHQFTINYEESDGTIYQASTNPIYITP